MPASAETLFDEMKRYVRFTAEDARELSAFGAVAAPHFTRISDEFYERIREHEGAHEVFTGEEQIQRLKRSLVRWMQRLCDGPHDESYYVERAKIGRVHVKIGLPQRYMLTAMALIRAEFESLTDEMPAEGGKRARHALARALDLELAIMLETYREDFVARLQRVERIETQRLERALAQSEHRYTSAVELARVLVVGLDANATITLFNREAESVTGWARDEALGRDFVELLLPASLHAEDGVRLRRAAAGEARLIEVWGAPLLTRSGNERTIQWQLAYAPHLTDTDVVVLAIGQDVTGEQELLQRTLRSEKLAAVGTLAAGLAHEIRNPLNGALLHVTFLERALERAGAGSEALDTARFIGTEIRRLSMLVKDFLVFARPAPPDFKPTSLREVCQRALDVLGEDAAEVKAELVTDFGLTEIVLALDERKMQQALLNLLKNAIDAVATTDGGRVILRTRRAPRQVLIEIEDDGPGLPSPDAPIFDAFYSTKAQGTGLGLAIVHRVVSDHGGTISVDSRAGRTVFRLALPLGGESQEEAP
jgi:PAS domain S-box-containing protein